jgi:hypothetical protein
VLHAFTVNDFCTTLSICNSHQVGTSLLILSLRLEDLVGSGSNVLSNLTSSDLCWPTTYLLLVFFFMIAGEGGQRLPT